MPYSGLLAKPTNVRLNSQGVIGATAKMTVLGLVHFLPFNSYQQVGSFVTTLLIYVKDTHPPPASDAKVHLITLYFAILLDAYVAMACKSLFIILFLVVQL